MCSNPVNGRVDIDNEMRVRQLTECPAKKFRFENTHVEEIT